MAGRLGLQLLDRRHRALHREAGPEIEARANRVLPKDVLFHEIAMLDPFYGKFGGIVIASLENENGP
jgi:hypothetical protein